jgi:type IV pilus assembly protein PilN
MIRTNLSTRPFYNERAVQLWLAGLALVVAIATLFNVARIIGYSRSDTELATQASRDEQRAADMRRDATRLRAGVDLQQIELASVEARQANNLIDRRTFSWTNLFNQFESTFPDNVRITSVRPQLDGKGGVLLTITVVARAVDDVDQLMGNLEGTGEFKNVLSVDERINDDGMLSATLEGTYEPKTPQPPTGAAVAPVGAPATVPPGEEAPPAGSSETAPGAKTP